LGIRFDNEAMTRVQGLIIIVILVAVTALGAYYYYPSVRPRKKLLIDFWYESSGHYPQSADQAVLIKTQLERTGVITVNLQGVEWATFRRNRAAETMPVFLAGWPPDYLDPDDYVLIMDSELDPCHTNYGNPEMDRLIEQARVTSDPATRSQLYSRIQKIMVDDAPIVPVWQGTAWAVAKPDVKGVAIDMAGYLYYWLIENHKDTLIIGTTDSVATNIDVAEADYFGTQVIMNSGAALVYIRPGSGAGPEDFVPGLATRWSVSLDGLRWTFDLRQGLQFYDGTEFNATHVKYSFDRSLALYLPLSLQVVIGYKEIIDRVEVTSKYQVVFHLKIPFAPFLSLMASPGSFIVNPKLAPMDRAVNFVDGDARASNPNDLGPYLLTSWIRKAGKDYEMRFDANQNYWGITDGYPKTKHILVKFYSDATALALAVRSGDIDMAYRQLAATDIKSFQTDPTLKVWEGTGAFIQFICFQEKIPPFDNPKVRQAVAAALNRTELVDTVFLGQAVPLYSIIPNGMAFHEDAYKTLGDANISLTVSLLQELGYG